MGMTPRSGLEDEVGGLLERIGLDLVKANHILYRKDGSEEAEIDLVFSLGNATFIVEVTESAQEETRRKKRKELREWTGRGMIGRISGELGLRSDNHTRIVYVSLATEGRVRPVIDGNVVLLHSDHMKDLSDCVDADPWHALEIFVEFCGLGDVFNPNA